MTPRSAQDVLGDSVALVAYEHFSNGDSVAAPAAWSSRIGTISGAGWYRALKEGIDTIRAVSKAQPSLSDAATITVVNALDLAPTLTDVLLTPTAVALVPGGTAQFTVAGSWSDGSATTPSVGYSATGGTVTAGGLYTAGTSAGTYRIIATQQGGIKADTSAVTIATPLATLLSLMLIPKSLTLAPGGTQQFSVAGSWSDGSSTVPAVSYAASGGAVTSAGLYTAGVTPGVFRVVATQQGGMKADTSTVTVVVPPPVLTKLIIAPKSLTLTSGSAQQFGVTGTWSDGSSTVPVATYSATGGMITATGLYTAGATAGSFRVIATQQSGTKADTSTVSVITAPSQSSSCQRSVSASTMTGFTTALSNALPGDCIQLAAGTYTLASNLTITRSGTSSAPIVIRGAGSSTIISVNQHFMYVDASYVQLRRLRLTDFNTIGLWFRGVTGVVVDSVEVDHTLQEAMAFKSGSNHNVVMNSLFHDTGILNPQYGEGIYIGSYGQPNAGVTDNQILNNHFGPNMRAEGVDVKEGSDRTIIRGNFFDGTGAVYVVNQTQALISVAANAVIVDSNFLRFGNPHGVTFLKGVGTMSGNVATRNTLDLQNIHGYALPTYGFNLFAGTSSGVTVSCNNVMLSGTLSNRPCAP